MSRASSLDLAPAARIRAAEAMRAAAGPELGPLALEQAVLKQRARAKHPDGERLWWTAEALEQASSYDVAVHRARRFADAPQVLDLCCSVGGDLLALAAVVPTVGVDLDEARLLLAAENATELGLSVQLMRADVTGLNPTGAVFADPARRAGGRRVFDPRAYTPPLDQLLGWLPQLEALGVKVAPGLDYDRLPPELEVELVSLRGDVKEAVLWGGTARRGTRRMATLLPGGDVLTDHAVDTPAVRAPGPFLLEPDGAVIRAHLVAQVAAQVQGWLLDETIAYVSAEAVVPTPFGNWYEVLEVLPFGLKALRERLRSYDAGPLVVKKRGTAVQPEELRRRLKLTGSRELTVVLTRAHGRQIALIARPVASLG
ncbi:MAG: class I SAM-dependent methyltransferase [Frankiaceae bacterium]|nr:class I SAM-dependent methyltransferase [Frankiaceae bacterium]